MGMHSSLERERKRKGKEMFKISVMHGQTFLFLLYKHFTFLTFLLPSPLSLPKVANNDLLAKLFKKKNFKSPTLKFRK